MPAAELPGVELMTTSLKDLYDQGRHREVIQVASRSTTPVASEPANSLIVAASLLQMGQLPQCRQICEALAPVLANDPQFLSLFATCLRRLGELDKSSAVFQEALRRYPDLPYLNNNYANLLIERGELSQAKQILESILKAHPNYADADANLQRLKLIEASSPAQSRNQESRQEPISGSEQALFDSGASQSNDDGIEKAAGLQPVIIDPLDLAFSEEEIEVDKSERRKRKSEAAARQLKGQPSDWSPLIDIPPLPHKELEEELVKACNEALIERQPEAALMLANLLNDLAPSAKQEARKIAADAFLMQKRHFEAEITLLGMLISGMKLDADRMLNIVGLALKRNDLQQAEHFLEQARKLDKKNERLEKLSSQIETLKQNKHRLAFPPYGHHQKG